MAVDFLKKQGRQTFTLDDDENGGYDIPDSRRTDETIESGISFDEAIAELTDSEKEIVNLHIGLELTFKEISEILRKPLGSVTWKYSRAISKLKKTVKEGAAI